MLRMARKQSSTSRLDKRAGPSPTPPSVGSVVLEKVREAAEGISNIRNDTLDDYVSIFDKLNVSSDLSYEQLLTLASLVRQFYAEGDSVKWLNEPQREWRGWRDEGSRRITTLDRKASGARRAIAEVRDYMVSIGLGNRLLDGTLEGAIAALNTDDLAEAAALIPSIKVTDVDRAAVVLYDFLVHQCGLLQNEAEVRVGKIGNYLWDWDVKVVEEYGKRENWKGCEAVRKAVRRRKRRVRSILKPASRSRPC